MADALSPPPRQAVVPPAETPSVPANITLLVGVAVIAALYLGREVFIPIVVAILLGFVLTPVVDLLRRVSPAPAAVRLRGGRGAPGPTLLASPPLPPAPLP